MEQTTQVAQPQKPDKPTSIKILQWLYILLALLYLLLAVPGLIIGLEVLILGLAFFVYSAKSLRVGYYLSIAAAVVYLLLILVFPFLVPEYRSGRADALIFTSILVFLPVLAINVVALFFIRRSLKSFRPRG